MISYFKAGATGLWKKAAVCAVLLFLLVSLSVFAAGEVESPVPEPVPADIVPVSYPMTVVDGLGNSVLIAEKPQRIASLTLFSDEVLFDLVDVGRLAVITWLASDGEYSNVADRAAAVGVQLDLNVEALIDIGPDIIFAANWSDPAKLEHLRRAGLLVYTINTPVSIAGIQGEILKLGTILDAEEAARAIIAAMDDTLNEVAEALAQLSANERRSAMDYNNWGSSSASGSSWHAILEAASVENAVAAFNADEYGQVPVSKELLLEVDPDVIFLPGWIWGDPEGAQKFEQEVKNDPAFRTLNAIRNDRVYLVPENLKSTYSHYIADTVRMVAGLVYPEYIH